MEILRSAPYFPVADVERTAAYYARSLGFETEYVAGSPAVFAICSRDHFAIFLRRVGDPSLIRPSEAQGGTWDAFFWVDDVGALFAELSGRGATVVYAPTPQEYGLLEFAVRDCDGHVLGFGQAMGEE
jgi:catechol 2,3-dioxygenase-like lactoylglutathione lyase family enzyme